MWLYGATPSCLHGEFSQFSVRLALTAESLIRSIGLMFRFFDVTVLSIYTLLLYAGPKKKQMGQTYIRICAFSSGLRRQSNSAGRLIGQSESSVDGHDGAADIRCSFT